MNAKIDELEKKTFEQDDSPEVPPPDIVAYNESRSCADLYRMRQQGILEIQPEFQREIVWKGPAQTRFIDSLIKQLPIPSLCFSMDFKTLRWQVIDGLQRMASIIRFLSGDPNWTLSDLEDITPELAGKEAKLFLDRKNPLHHYYQRVENLTLPITVIRCDYSKKTNTNYLFTIFHRLNTGAMKLNNQEIRNCIYSGAFNDLLKKLNSDSIWLKLNRMKKDTGYRFTKQELILRFFAFHNEYESYGGRLAKFLNDYMADHRNLDEKEIKEKTNLFNRTIETTYKKVFSETTPSGVSISVLEATLVGVSKNIDHLEKLSAAAVQKKFEQMLKHDEFSDEKLSEGLSGKPRVLGRMKAAIDSFA